MSANAYVMPDANVLIPLSKIYDLFTSESAEYSIPLSEYVPIYFDDDPIAPEEEEDLSRSWEDLKSGKIKTVPRTCTDDDFLKMLKN
ncbi:MAG: hypothetical protein FWC44_01135 [Methanomassiliicoccaceae archaeon]|nr:hypothetical protein [Methanomassiliicoccaceae archaeon]